MLTFRVEDDVEIGETPITFQALSATDVNLMDLPVAGRDGLLTIEARLGGDANRDSVVDLRDLVAVAGAFNTLRGSAGYIPDADLNGDEIVNVYDLAEVGMNFGASRQ